MFIALIISVSHALLPIRTAGRPELCHKTNKKNRNSAYGNTDFIYALIPQFFVYQALVLFINNNAAELRLYIK